MEDAPSQGDSSSLWRVARDHSQHLVFRSQALRRLILIQVPGIEEYVTSLLSTDDNDQWFTALDLLALLSTDSSRVILREEHNRVDEVHRPYVMKALAKSLLESRGNEVLAGARKSHLTEPILDKIHYSEPY